MHSHAVDFPVAVPTLPSPHADNRMTNPAACASVPSSGFPPPLTQAALLHRALKKVARSVDKMSVHNYLSLKKVLEQHVGREARLSSPDMEALRHYISELRVSYGKL